MKRLIHRWRRWLDWKEFAKEKYGPVKRFLIFLGIIYNKWFETFVDWNKGTVIENSTSRLIEQKSVPYPMAFFKEDLENMENEKQ